MNSIHREGREEREEEFISDSNSVFLLGALGAFAVEKHLV
jgi:hypothetical protein